MISRSDTFDGFDCCCVMLCARYFAAFHVEGHTGGRQPRHACHTTLSLVSTLNCAAKREALTSCGGGIWRLACPPWDLPALVRETRRGPWASPCPPPLGRACTRTKNHYRGTSYVTRYTVAQCAESNCCFFKSRPRYYHTSK